MFSFWELFPATTDTTAQLELDLARSLRGFCKNEYYLVFHPLETKILARNGLAWSCIIHAWNITAWSCETRSRKTLVGNSGEFRFPDLFLPVFCSEKFPISIGRRVPAIFWSSDLHSRHKFSAEFYTISFYTYVHIVCHMYAGLAFLARPGLRDETKVSWEKSRTHLARSSCEINLYAQLYCTLTTYRRSITISRKDQKTNTTPQLYCTLST